MNKHLRDLWFVSTCLVATATASPVTATTITFDAGAGTPLCYMEAGMTVCSGQAPGQDHVHLGDNDGNGSPDLANHSGCCSTPYSFDLGGSPFTLVGFDFVRFAGTHTFTSSSGAVLNVTTSGPVTFSLTGWAGITGFTWDLVGGGCCADGVMDNLVFSQPDSPFSDGTFADADWDSVEIGDTACGSFTAAQVTSGGNPDAFRRVTHSFCLGSLDVGHLRVAAVYDPPTQGAVSTVSFAFDARHLNASPEVAVAYAGLLFQNGSYYIGPVDPVFGDGWTHFERSSLTAGDFSRVGPGPGPATPDFSSAGAPIRFGYFTANSSQGGPCDPADPCSVPQFRESGIDNWSVVVGRCGDGIMQGPEQCDDGNGVGGDCCSASCQFEATGSSCASDGNACTDDVCNGAATCTHPNKLAGASCPGDGNVCTDDVCNGAGTCTHPNKPAPCNLAPPCAGARPPGTPLFPRPKKAKKFQASLVQTFMECGFPNAPNTVTEGNIPACQPVTTPNEEAGGPMNGWQWDETKSQGSIALKATCPGAANVQVTLKLSGIIDGSGQPTSGAGTLVLPVRATLNDPTGGDMTSIDLRLGIAFALVNGGVTLKTTSDAILSDLDRDPLPNGTSIELAPFEGLAVLDANGNDFARPGIFLP